MPSMADLALQPTSHKILIMAPSGTGKTALIGSLANAGYRCFVLDYDNGADILYDPKFLRRENRKNVILKTLTDRVTDDNSALPTAASLGLKALDNWIEPDPADPKKTISFGGLSSWTSKDVLVLDTLGFFGDACLRYVLYMNNRAGKQPQLQDYGTAMDILERLLEKLYSGDTHCHVVVMAHGAPMTDASQMTVKLVPIALGSKLPPKVPRYFNNMVTLEKRIVGSEVQVFMRTEATALMDLKTTAPSVIPKELPANLATLFSLLDSSRASGAPGQAPAKTNP